ncbi:MAG: biotin transporter BioY [Clostridiales bacterium]|uniref:biotin transporter BioY n=1 Tax=Clostridium sp. N3C TaxID=1776758 RepID=UPI00092DEC34|nr:biotin transporter BioY [Clostridium sp. N3C]NLZ48374.1 biotin transporter BioY [Clostridiales bacterium]SCN26484.1 Biotin ECF transporter S component BioY [Clostridium sp. N3C]
MKLNLKMMMLTSMFTALIAIGAFIKIPLGPFFPAITLQVFFVVLSPLILGKYYGALCSIIYLLLGLIGVPVFANGGGIGYVIQPSFGYLLGFIPATFAIGYLSEKFKKKSFVTFLICCGVGILIDYIIGVPYLYCILKFLLHKNINITDIVKNGFLIFVPGDLVKCIIASMLAVRIIPQMKNIKADSFL